jgi:O-antigen/teichoic acid export membrane protein
MVAMNAFATAWPPFFMSYINKRDEARQVFAHVLTYYIIGFGSLVVAFFFVAKPLTVIMTAPAFHEAWVVVGLVAAAYALKGCYLILLPGIYFSEKLSRQSMIEWSAAVLNIALNFWLIPLYGVLGAAIATFFSYLILTFLAWVVARHHLKVDYEWSRVFLSALSICLCCGVIYYISTLQITIYEAAFYSASGCFVYIALAIGFLLSQRERYFLKRKIGI